MRINSHDGTNDFAKVFTITIIDDISPKLSNTSPTDNATDISINTNLVATFDKAVVANSGDIVIKKSTDDELVESIGATEVSIDGAVVTITPSSLAFNTEYYILIDADAFEDGDDNFYAGIADATSWSFTTRDGFALSKTTASVNESGTTDSFTVVLNDQPITDVVFNITSDNTDEATLSPATLTFLDSTWNIAQTITITGVDDDIVDGNQLNNITVSVDDTSSDDRFNALEDKSVAVTTVDDDTPAIVTPPSTGGGGSAYTPPTVEPKPEPEVVVVTPTQIPPSNTGATGTQPQLDSLTQLYIATFGRAPDARGRSYWMESGFTLEQIAMSFFDQEETQTRYPIGTSNEAFIEAVYHNLFTREPDSEGFAYWLEALESSRVTRDLFILAVINGALGDDKTILTNKTVVGVAFADDGRDDIDEAKSILDEITTEDPTVTQTLCSYALSSCGERN